MGSATPAARVRQSAVPPIPRPVPARGRPESRRSSGSQVQSPPGFNRPLLVLLAGLGLVAAAGLPYYLRPLAERVRSPLHAWFRPSGYIGQTAGIVALAVFLVLWLYPLRKKYRWLGFTGAVGRWLDVHITAALCLPLLLAIHANWRFEGLIGLGFIAILVVCLSGVVGRYLYTRIPRSRSGLELSIEEVAARRRELLDRVAEVTGVESGEIERMIRIDPAPYDGRGIFATLWRMWRDDRARRAVERELRRRWSGGGLDRSALRRAVAMAGREIALTQQARMLSATHRIFRYWHVAHRPFAVTALLAVAIHVAVVVAVGMTWFW